MSGVIAQLGDRRFPGIKACAICHAPVQTVNYALGPQVMHYDPDSSFPTTQDGTAWRHCKSSVATIAEVVVPPLVEQLVSITLVPVEVFGADECCEHGIEEPCPSKGSGLCDAVSAWSDCNRAVGRIYRVDDMPPGTRDPADTLTLLVSQEQRAWFDRKFGAGS